jgi:ribonuclease-3
VNSREFQDKLCYEFCDAELLKKALTHSSYAKEKSESAFSNNERLEFLGDAFFDAIIGEELYRKLENAPEGSLTKLRALVVCEKSLASCGRSIGIGKYILLGRGEENTGGRNKDAVIADAVEAVIGAV